MYIYIYIYSHTYIYIIKYIIYVDSPELFDVTRTPKYKSHQATLWWIIETHPLVHKCNWQCFVFLNFIVFGLKISCASCKLTDSFSFTHAVFFGCCVTLYLMTFIFDKRCLCPHVPFLGNLLKARMRRIRLRCLCSIMLQKVCQPSVSLHVCGSHCQWLCSVKRFGSQCAGCRSRRVYLIVWPLNGDQSVWLGQKPARWILGLSVKFNNLLQSF